MTTTKRDIERGRKSDRKKSGLTFGTRVMATYGGGIWGGLVRVDDAAGIAQQHRVRRHVYHTRTDSQIRSVNFKMRERERNGTSEQYEQHPVRSGCL
jgi:hypothetical protein